jgi:hypothetical protein
MTGESPRPAWVRELPRWGAALLAGAVVWQVFAVLVEPLDFRVFWTAGRDVLAGLDPYPVPGTPSVADNHQFVYPYVAVVPFVAWGLLPWSVAAPLYLAVSVVAVVAAVWVTGVRDVLAAPLVLLASVTVIGLQIGSLNALFLLGLVLAWRWRDRPWVAGVVVGLMITAKLFLFPVVAWLLFCRRTRAAVVAAVLPAVGVGAGWLVGPLDAQSYLQLLGELSAGLADNGASVSALFHAYGLDALARPGTVLLAGAGLGIAWWRYRRGHDERLVFTAAVLVALVLSPIVWAHYLVLLAAPLLVLGAGRAALLWFAATSWLVYLPHHVGDAVPDALLRWAAPAAGLVAVSAWAVDQRRSWWWTDVALWAALLGVALARPLGVTPLAAGLWLGLCGLWVYRRTAPTVGPGRLGTCDGDNSGRQGDGGSDPGRAGGPGGEAGAGRHPARAGHRPRR